MGAALMKLIEENRCIVGEGRIFEQKPGKDSLGDDFNLSEGRDFGGPSSTIPNACAD